MPLYEYECRSCGEVVEALVRTADDVFACEACGSERTRKIVSLTSSPSVKSKSLTMASPGGDCGAPRCCGGGCDI